MHQLHEVVGNMLAEAEHARFLPGCTVVRDPACGGHQRLPLFCYQDKSRKTEYCNVDLLILKENKVRLIVEIEEANITPIQICGKFLASALSTHFIHEKWGDPVEIGDPTLFIHVLDTSRLKLDKTSKIKQWNRLEQSIRGVLPIKDGGIRCYRMFQGDTEEFAPSSEKSKALLACVKTFISDYP